MLITLLFDVIRNSYSVHFFFKAIAISGISCCNGYLVTMATEVGAYNIAVCEGTGTLFLVHTFLQATAVLGITCCYGYFSNRNMSLCVLFEGIRTSVLVNLQFLVNKFL